MPYHGLHFLKKADSELVSVNNITFSPIKTELLDKIRTAMQRNETLTLLRNLLIEGWPTDKVMMLQRLISCYNYQIELAVQDGIIL